jgi:hypothetical protein
MWQIRATEPIHKNEIIASDGFMVLVLAYLMMYGISKVSVLYMLVSSLHTVTNSCYPHP